MQLGDDLAVVDLALETKGWAILSAYPLRTFTLPGSQGIPKEGAGTDVAVLGLMGKMTGAAAVVGTPETRIQSNGQLRISVSLKVLGVLGVYVSALGTWEGGFGEHVMVLMKERAVPAHTVSVLSRDKRVLEIDVEKAWEEMGLQAGWGNEVEIVVLVS
ncbi:MAG: hypothetical protein Q9218_007255 [Villophora microphyllina]